MKNLEMLTREELIQEIEYLQQAISSLTKENNKLLAMINNKE